MAFKGVQPVQVHHALRATLALRIFSVLIAGLTLPVRENLPADMMTWYGLIAPPLFCLNLAWLIFARPLASYLVNNYQSFMFFIPMTPIAWAGKGHGMKTTWIQGVTRWAYDCCFFCGDGLHC